MSLPFAQPPESLCIIRLSAIGDTCHTVPVVRAIQDAWPSTALTWIIGKTEHTLLKGLDGVEFVVLDKTQGVSGYAAVRRALGRRRFDALLHMHASTRANLVSLLVRAKLRIGFDKARARDQQWLFTNHKLPARRERHVMDGLFEFAELIGVERGTPRWDLAVSADDVAAIAPTSLQVSRRSSSARARASAFATIAIGAWSPMPRSPTTRRSTTAPKCS